MNDRLKMVQSLLLEALEIETTEERAAFLSDACGGDEKVKTQVEALIAAQIAAGQFLPDRPSRNAARAAWAGVAATGTCADDQFQISVTEKPGDWIGQYRLLEKLGEGGCGLVYMAEQEKPVRRKVALKVIKLGMDTRQVLARFEAERQALALMDHPNIAKVLDAGASAAGRPFFVMELVRGVRITNFCDQQEFSSRARLEMFIKVCQAVQHAHQKGIVHRDIKPSNILVTDHDGVPVPKIIDFGIAKATTDQRLTDKTLLTSLDQVIGTPTYMSPEQAKLGGVDIDTRSDIYSLGVLLYELLTGRTPFETTRLREAGLDELRRIIREEEPLRPSTKLRNLQAAQQMKVARHQKSDPTKLVNLLRGDLDWIVMKALEKDRNRRYETANGLAMDIQRHLNNEPVVARPTRKLYKFRKLVLRNKRGFTAAAAIAMALVLGLALSLWQAMRATRAEAKARDSAWKAQLAKEDEAKQRRAAESARRQSEENGIRLAHALDRAEMQRVEEFFSGEDSSSALAYLARLLRRDPTNEIAAERLLSGLTLRGYALRLTAPIRHEDTVFCVQFSPDGRRVVTASDDSTARVWDAQTGQPLTPPLRHSNRVWYAEFSPDGTRVATASKDHTARIWDAQTGQPLTEPLKHGDDVSFARFSRDGRWVITASDDHTARIWETETGQPRSDPLRHGEHVRSAEFSPDGRWVVTASDDKTARVWDGRTGQPLSEPLKHESRVWYAQFSPEGLRVVTASGDKTARVWAAESGRPLTEPLKHEGEVVSARFSPDGERVVTASEDRTARIWDTKTGKLLTDPLKHQGKVFTASFSMDGLQVVTASDDRTARIWDARTGRALTESLKHEDSVRYAQFSPDGLRVITGSEDRTAQVWDAQPHQLLADPLWHADHVTSAQFAPDGKRVVTGSDDSTAKVWDTQTAQALTRPLKHFGRITSVRFSPNGDRVLTASVDRTARIWDARTGNQLGEPLRHMGAVNSAEFSHDGLKIVTASQDGTSRIWDAITGERLKGPLNHDGGVLWAEFSPDGKQVVTAGEDNTARIWDAETGQPHTVPLKHANLLSFARFSQDGKRIATACDDGTARLWDANTGELLTPLLRHEDRVTSVQFSPDGKRVLTGSWDRTARIWDSQTGQPLTEPLKHKDHVKTAQFSGDGHRVVTVSDDGTARVWDVQTGQALSEPLKHGDRVNSGSFSSDNQRVLTASADATARVWDVPSVVAPVPGWVTEVVEQIATKRVNDYSVIESVPFDPFPALRAQIITSTNQDIWTRWGKWLFAESSVRTMSPFSDVRVADFVKQPTKQSSLAELHRAVKVEPTNAVLLARTARAILARAPESLARHIPSRDPKAAPELVDLTSYYNASLDKPWHPGQDNNDLSALPRGIQRLSGVLFDVRGLIQVGAELNPGKTYPDRVENIQIGCDFRKLHFLHSAINCFGVSKGTQIGSYSIHYANGEAVEIPIVLGHEVADWWDQPNEENAEFSIAWEGTNEAARNVGRKIRLFHTVWMNPSPEKIVKSIDFSSVKANAAPFLIAVTVE